jgi:hypothetical protein
MDETFKKQLIEEDRNENRNSPGHRVDMSIIRED